MARRPTPKQTELLAEIDAGVVTSRRLEGGWSSGRRDPSFSLVTAAAETAIRHGWAEPTFSEGDLRVLRLTGTGRATLDEARTLAEHEALPAEWHGLARVARRRRGNYRIRGGGKVPDGREVICTPCNRAAWSAGRMALAVWYTNEGGRDADRAAEVALARHVLAHYRGEYATPSRDTETTP